MAETFEFMERLIKDIPDTFDVLEIGCGKGLYGYMFRAMYVGKVYLEGIDLSIPSRFQVVVNDVYDKVVKGDIVGYVDILIKEKQRYHLVIGTHVFEHIPEFTAYDCIEKLKKVGEFVVLAFPTPIDKLYRQDTGAHGHKWCYSMTKLKGLGFRKVWGIDIDNVFLWTRRKLPLTKRVEKFMRRSGMLV
jgi:predicted TPR repeat methyltransferase